MMTDPGAPAPQDDADAPAAHPRYWLWALLFCANLAVYFIGCAFWTRLSTGAWITFSSAAFRSSLLNPLAGTLAMPLQAVHHPWMVVVYALLMTQFVITPVLMAAYYRLLAATVFVVVLALFAHSVVMALATMIGALAVAYARRRGLSPLISAAMGLIPPGLLLGLVAYAGFDSLAVQPIQRWIPVSWLLLAIVLSLPLTIGAAWLCRLLGTRRGVLLPAQAIVLLAALALFSTQVGADQLAFALLERRLETADTLLEPQDLELWQRRTDERGLDRTALLNSLRGYTQSRCRSLAAYARDFLRDHPSSDHVPQVLWILAQCDSVQINEHAVESGQVKFVADWPQEGSVDTWKRLVDRHPAQRQSALALWRLGEIHLRRGEMTEADDLLLLAQNRLEKIEAEPQAQRNGDLFAPPPELPPPGYYAKALERVRLLRWLIERNKVLEDPAAAEVFAAWLRINPYQRDAAEQLRRLLEQQDLGPNQIKVAETSIADNLRLAIAMTIQDRLTRAQRLLEIAQGLDDAAIQANYELGRLLVQDASLARRVEGIQTAQRYFTLVSQEAVGNPWQRAAADNLQWLLSTRPTP